MAVNVPLRIKLSIFYALIVAVSLLGFGAYTYFSVSSDLHSNLDASLLRVASSLEFIIKNKPDANLAKSFSRYGGDKFAIFRESEKMRFVGPLRPSLVNEGKVYEPDIVWSAVYEHILMNPKNYYIQISDTNQSIIWRSKNLYSDSLPKTDDIEAFTKKDTISLMQKDSMIKLKYDRLNNTKFDSAFADIYIKGESVRLLIKKTDNAIISIAYIISDIKTSLYQLFIIQLIALPFILVISIISGLFLSKLSLKTIEDITRRADVITASNLKDRLPHVETNDEVGHLTRTLNQMFERLESSFIQIKKFTSDASHELRTPLTILRGELELALHKQKTPAEYEAVLISALEEVARLTNVAETLLELSRAESGQIQMNLLHSNFSKLVSDIAEDAEILAEIKNVKVYSNIENDIYLPFDGARMHQAILNIVDNAVKYTPPGGSVYIELAKNAKTADVIVRDTGVGIPEEDLPHIFDRLYRVDKARSSSVSGAGLGLSIVKWIIGGHKGTIDVSSINNKGTTFKVSLHL